MALEVGKADEYVRVHHGPADFGLLHIFAADDRHSNVVGTFQSVANEDRAAHRQRRKTVFPWKEWTISLQTSLG